MKQFKRQILLLIVFLSFTFVAKAQFYEIANQVPQLLSPALSGSFNYKGYIEASYIKGIGDERIDFVDISTTQGFKYANWLFMGVGAGVDMMLPSVDIDHHSYDPAVMVPLYADFRFLIGNQNKIGINLDLRFGAAFLFDSFPTNNGWLVSEENFYLRPSLSMRIPINKNKPKQAFNIGFAYQLIVGDFSGYHWDSNKGFNSLGATIGFEW
ncbi:MAG: hypothetical protein IJC40_00960 [Muribaculaceae bacterium]|nr:hypothetical protein [Muribaculaceae bacterium]